MTYTEREFQVESKWQPGLDPATPPGLHVFPLQNQAEVDSQTNVDVVFIHGLGKTWQQTWGGDTSSTWLRFIETDLHTVRIMTYGFSVIETLDSNPNTLEIESRKLLQELRNHWKSDDAQRSIIFVAHSLGGLILERALIAFPSDIINAIIGVIFLGTPQFTTTGEWGKFGVNIAKSFSEKQLLTQPKAEILCQLREEFDTWLKPNKTWAENRVCCVSEELPVYRVGLIVPESSAQLRSVKCATSSLHADHFSISRCRTAFDPQYQRVAQMLKGMTAKTTSRLVKELSDISYEQPKESEKASLRLDGRESLKKFWTRASEPMRFVSQALTLEDQGRYEAAGRAYEEAIKSCSKSTDDEQTISLFCMDKKALMLMDDCKYEEADKLSLETWEERKSKKGKADASTLLSAANRARILRYRGQFSAAYDILRDSLASMPECPFNTIVGTAVVSILAKVLKDQGILEVSELLSRDVVRACRFHLGRDHPYTYNRQSDLGVVLSKRQQFVAAEQITRQALEGLRLSLGALHPHTLRTAKRLGSYLRFQGRLEEALPLLRTTLECQIALFGSVHPDTLSTRCSLAAAYALLDRLDEAGAMLQGALKDRKKLFDENHPDVLWTQRMLSAVENMRKTTSNDVVEDSTEFSSARAVFMSPTTPSDKNYKERTREFQCPAYDPDKAYPDDIPALEILRTNAGDVDSSVVDKHLRLAAASGEIDVVRKFLDNAANINAEGGYYGDALQAAAFAGSYGTSELLLGWSKGPHADVNAMGGIFGSALRAAALGGHEKIVLLLLENGANPCLEHHILGSALEAALVGRHENVVRTLIEKMPILPPEKTHPLALFVRKMISEDNFEVVKLLLTAMSKSTQSAALDDLHLQQTVTQQVVLQLLLSKHAEVHPSEVGSALQLAITGGHTDALKILFRTRAVNLDTNIPDVDVLAASVAGQQVVAALILEQQDQTSTTRIVSASTGSGSAVEEDANVNGETPDAQHRSTRFVESSVPQTGATATATGRAGRSATRRSWAGRSSKEKHSIRAAVRAKWRSLTTRS